MHINNRDFINGLAKGLRILEVFSKETVKLTISQAANHTGLDRATTRRCLLTLAKLGYCSYDGKFFALTSRILKPGMSFLASMPLASIVQPLLEKLSHKLQQSTSVSILDGHEIIYIARASLKRLMSVTLMPGSRLPASCTSMGRVLLAALPPQKMLEQVQATPLIPYTPYTITEISLLQNELETIRQQGYALVYEEIEMGLCSIAVPLINSQNQTIAALNIGLSTATTDRNALIHSYLPELLNAQQELKSCLIDSYHEIRSQISSS